MKPHKTSREPIAIVGLSCRFPGASTLQAFWNLLRDRQETITEIPKERWDASQYYDPQLGTAGKTHQRHASLLSDIHDFDPLFFNISPAEASEMSPSQKLMLELSWEAIEQSTIPFRRVQGKNVSVFVGNIWTDFEHFRKSRNARATLHSAVGMSSNVVANRVSFAMGLTGPSLVIDTGCSASLTALHLACQNLQQYESEMSIVGGINHILDPDKYIELTTFGGLSVKGKCSTFDKDADGFVRGEGGGVLLLKRLSDAERDGDRIYAVIRGTAVNNNGFNDTLPATSTEGQLALLDWAYRDSGIAPHEVHYIEAHGTGTKLGDPNEAKAIGAFFNQGRTSDRKLRLGSVKTNIGHTEATAGLAGIIKVVLAMQHRMLPPNLNFSTPNPDIPFEELNLEVQQDLTPWPVKPGETFKAGVNSFGWGGTNAHAVVEEYVHQQESVTLPEPVRMALPLSAKSSQALKDYAGLYRAVLSHADDAEAASVLVSTALRKASFDHRQYFYGESREALIEALEQFTGDESDVTPYKPLSSKDKVVFIFSGQGGQWLNMGRRMLGVEPVFTATIEACDRAFRPYTDWSLLEELNATPEQSRLNEIQVIQPAICAVQIALARVWMSWGVTPQAVVGHSMGEVAAAHVAGVLSLDDAARVICTRSRLMQTVAGKGGAMAVTELSYPEAQKVAARYEGKLSVAVNNSHKSTVLAGDKASIDMVLAELDKRGLFCRMVKVDVASHSPQMDPLKEPLREALQGITPHRATIPFISTVIAAPMDGSDMGPDYWVSNLRGTVQFAAVMNLLMRDQHTVFVETNPHPVLVNAVNECAEHLKRKVITVGSLHRDFTELEMLHKNLGELFQRGYEPDWTVFYGTTRIPHVPLPAYPFQRERYELEDLSHQRDDHKPSQARFPMLGERLNLANLEGTYFWSSTISLHKFNYLRDHLMHGRIELPVSCLIEVLLEATTEIFSGEVPVQITDIAFTQPIILTEQGKVEMQVKLMLKAGDVGSIEVYKKESTETHWGLCATGTAQVSTLLEPYDAIFGEIDYQHPSYTEGLQYYNMLRAVGLQYGGHYQQITGIDRLRGRRSKDILFSIKPTDAVRAAAGQYKIHPTLISNFLQPVFSELTGILEEGSHLKVGFTNIGRIEYQVPVTHDRELRGLMSMKSLERKDDHVWEFSSDIVIANHDNTPVMRITGLRGQAERKEATQDGVLQLSADSFSGRYATQETDADKCATIEQMLIQHISSIIKIAPNRIKRTMTFKGMGVDSLMAVQLRNLVEKDCEVKLTVGMFWNHPSVQEYALYLKDVLDSKREERADAKQVAMVQDAATTWFTITPAKATPTYRLFCFHDAGGSASLFDGWDQLIDAGVELVVVEMPGRGRRVDEAPYKDVKSLIHDMLPAFEGLLDKPYTFLGHSMGGMVAYELVREFRRMQMPLPVKLFISSTSGLGAYDKHQVDYRLTDEELTAMYPHLSLEQVGGNTQIQALMINILRQDLEFLYNYNFTQEEPLSLPIIAIHGNEDERVKRHQIEQWALESSAGFRLVPRSGGHRYIQHDADFVVGLVHQEMMNGLEQHDDGIRRIA